MTGRRRAVLIWAALICAVAIPLVLAALSPLLAWRGPAYIAAGFAGIVAFALVLAQPLLAGGYLPGLPARRGRAAHRVVGIALVVAILAHVGGLWLTSPPDVIDALLFDSPTPFSVWGVLAMWAAFAAALLAAARGRLGPRAWRLGHTGLALTIASGSVAHALLIEGTMETISKVALCALVVAATGRAVYDLRAWTLLARRRS